ncbi:anti-sigma factor family protein [Candidatus Latescibacterota bacterium]
MDCEKVREYLPFLCDGSIDSDTVEQVKIHLVKCDECQNEYNKVTDMLQQIQVTLSEDIPEAVPGYVEAVWRKIDKKKIARSIYWRTVSAAAVVVLAVTVVMYGYIDRNSEIPPVSENVVFTEPESEYDEYVMSEYMTKNDIPELIDTVDIIDDQIIVDALITNSYHNIRPEEIINLMDEDELVLLFASLER